MRPKKDDRAVRFNIPQRPRYAPIQVKVFEQAIEEGVRHQTRLKEQIERGEFEEGGDTSDLAFMAEVRDTLRYFDEKESGDGNEGARGEGTRSRSREIAAQSADSKE